MSQATYDELMELRKKKQKRWEAHEAPPIFLLESFFSAFRVLLEGGCISLDAEFSELLLVQSNNLHGSYQRNNIGVPPDVFAMTVALKNHIQNLKTQKLNSETQHAQD